MAFPLLKTDRLLLRQIDKEDIQHIFEGLSNPEVIKFYGISYTSLESTKEQMTWYSNLEKSKTGIWWAISSQDKRKFYGAIGFYGISREHKKAEIGYWLLPEFWGKGYIQEAASKVVQYAFETLELHRIEALIESENSASAKTLEKLGFQFEGRMRDSEIKNEKYITVDIFSKLNE